MSFRLRVVEKFIYSRNSCYDAIDNELEDSTDYLSEESKCISIIINEYVGTRGSMSICTVYSNANYNVSLVKMK